MRTFEWMIALRYLRARRQEGFISVTAGFSLLGIALGVATLIVVMAVMNGFRSELLGRILGMNGHITVNAAYGALPDYDALAHDLARIAHVRHVIPLVEGQVMASAHGVVQGLMINGIRPQDIQHKPLIEKHIVAGSLADFMAGTGIMIGKRLAERMSLKIGDRLTLISPEGRATIAGLMPRVKAYPVVALFDVGMYEYDSGLAFMNFSEAQIYFQLIHGDRRTVSALEVMLSDPKLAPAIAADMQKKYAQTLRIYDWQQSNGQFFNAVQVERNVMFLILTLIILVAAFNIISSLIMLVRDKTRDIAILRTMGATRSSILRIFFLCGSSIGIIGTLLGVLLGLAFALNIDSIKSWLEGLTHTELFSAEIYFLSHLPAIVDLHEVIQISLMALTLSLLATWYPAHRAAKLDPAEALRYE